MVTVGLNFDSWQDCWSHGGWRLTVSPMSSLVFSCLLCLEALELGIWCNIQAHAEPSVICRKTWQRVKFPIAHGLQRSHSILAAQLRSPVLTGMQGPFQVWLTSHGGSQEENLNIFWTLGREVTVSVDETSLLIQLVQNNFKPQNT